MPNGATLLTSSSRLTRSKNERDRRDSYVVPTPSMLTRTKWTLSLSASAKGTSNEWPCVVNVTARRVALVVKRHSSTNRGYFVGSPPPKPTPRHPSESSSVSHAVSLSNGSSALCFGAKQNRHDRSHVFVSEIDTCRGAVAQLCGGISTSSRSTFAPVRRSNRCSPIGPARIFHEVN